MQDTVSQAGTVMQCYRPRIRVAVLLVVVIAVAILWMAEILNLGFSK